MAIPTQRFRHEIAPDVTVKGRFSYSGDARIQGKVKGSVHAFALLLVDEAAHVEADILAHHLIVKGTVIGQVNGEHVELTDGARVVGDVAAENLVIRDGASLEGTCRIVKKGSLGL